MLIDTLNLPGDLRKISYKELLDVCEETRNFLINTLADTGGHLASGLGTVELTVGLHAVYNTPHDKIIWDVGHQCYPHKILTGRKNQLHTIRKFGGLSPFLKRSESVYDEYGAGHASTAISAALGIAEARDLKGEDFSVAAVIGDATLSGGLAFEGINNAKNMKNNFTIILNDNDMSISKPVGAISTAITKMRLNPKYKVFRELMEKMVSKVPAIGEPLVERVETAAELFRDFFFTETEETAVIFEELGFRYFGPIDGHDLGLIIPALKYAKEAKGPVLLHFITQKGKGYQHAEADPIKYHGVTKFDVQSGVFAKKKDAPPTYSDVYGKTLQEIAKTDDKVVVVTPAMIEGSGLVGFANEFPKRLFDVGIAEEHAVTFSTGLALQGLKVACSIYSSFLQRAYDQILHDAALQNIPVFLGLDRGGIAGADGPTHHGLFDYSYLRNIPGMVCMAPKDENELRHMIKTGLEHRKGPISVRFPRGEGYGVKMDSELKTLTIGKGEIVFESKNSSEFDLGIIAVGNMVYPAIETAQKLEGAGLKIKVINARFVKPLDEKLITETAKSCEKLVTIEENVLAGGFGSAVLELLNEKEIQKPVLRLGIPDEFVTHGSQVELQDLYGLTPEKMAQKILEKLKQRVFA